MARRRIRSPFRPPSRSRFPPPSSVADVPLQRRRQRGGGRGEPLAEELVHEVTGRAARLLPTPASRRIPRASGAAARSSSEYTDGQRFEATLRVQRLAVGVDEVALQATDHHAGQAVLVGQHVPGEALVVQQFEERRERLGVAVVRRGRQEQLVLEVRAPAPGRAGSAGSRRRSGRPSARRCEPRRRSGGRTSAGASRAAGVRPAAGGALHPAWPSRST